MNKKILIVLFLNLFFSIFELYGGLITNSTTILSDSLHDAVDVLSIIIFIVLEKKSSKKPDNLYTFGYSRYSVLGALVTNIALFLSSLFIIFNSLNRIVNPIKVNYNSMIIFSIIGIVINLIATKFTSKTNTIGEKSINLHMLEDTFGFVVILLGSILIKLTNFYIIDAILSLTLAIFILIKVLKNTKEVFDIFLEKKPNNILIDELIKEILNTKRVIKINKMNIWTLDGKSNYLNLSLLVDVVTIKELISIRENINRKVDKYNINNLSVEFTFK